MQKIKYKIYTFGCKVNQYDSCFLEKELLSFGCFEKSDDEFDLIIVNTCAVTRVAISKEKRFVNKLKKENKNACFVIFGCWPKVYQEDFLDKKFDIVRNTGEFDLLLCDIKKFFSIKNKQEKQEKLVAKNRVRYTIKIQEGCEQFCTYCIIPYARGKLKSRDTQEVLAEITEAIKYGYKEIILCGIHLGLYGVDLETKINLTDLLKEILKIKDLGRVRLSSIEVTEVSDELIELIKNNSKICPHLHIPLQAGSPKILKLMNRPYDLAYFEKRIKKLRKEIPQVAITTDIIVGFPQEEENDFKQTYEFVKKIKFSKAHIFPFSAHPKTPAYKMTGQVDKKIIKERSEDLRILSEKMEKEYINSFLGQDLAILIERLENDFFIGKSEYYFEVKIPFSDNLKIGEIKFLKYSGII